MYNYQPVEDLSKEIKQLNKIHLRDCIAISILLTMSLMVCFYILVGSDKKIKSLENQNQQLTEICVELELEK